LKEYGGLYLDFDQLIYQYDANFNRQFEFLGAYYDKEHGQIVTIETSIIAAAKGHAVLTRALDLVTDVIVEDL